MSLVQSGHPGSECQPPGHHGPTRRQVWTGYGVDIDIVFSRRDGKVVDKFFMETAAETNLA
jgi:hypothetical protein